MDKHSHVRKEYAGHAAYYDERWARYNRVSSGGTLDAIAQYLRNTDSNRSIDLLDIACGTGSLLEQIHSLQPGITLFGLDLSDHMLAKAQQRLGPQVNLRQGNAEQLPFSDQQFDIAVCNSAAQYFTDLPRFFREASRVLKPGGHLILTAWTGDGFIAGLHYSWLRWRHPAIHNVLKTSGYAKLLELSGFELLDAKRYNAGPLWMLTTLRARSTTSLIRQGIVAP